MTLLLPLIPTDYADAASKVKLNKTKMTLYIGKPQTLKITGTSKTVTWSSSDKNVATVSKKGKVTGKSTGKATITAKVGKKKYKCSVTVKKPSINTKKKTLCVGDTYTLKLTGTEIKSVKTSNKKIAAVSKKGKVTAKKAGTATITLTGTDGKKYTCKITVKKPVLNVTDKTILVKQTFTLKLKGATAKAFSSSDKNIATVSPEGLVKGVSVGTATITVKDTNGKKYKCKVEVTERQWTTPDGRTYENMNGYIMDITDDGHWYHTEWVNAMREVAAAGLNNIVYTEYYDDGTYWMLCKREDEEKAVERMWEHLLSMNLYSGAGISISWFDVNATVRVVTVYGSDIINLDDYEDMMQDE